jgi:hypothetical protein
VNGLSWLLYLADVCNEVDGVFGFLTFLGAAGTIIAILIRFGTKALTAEDEMSERTRERVAAGTKFVLKWTFPTFLVSLILFAVLPEKNTLYAIAASELGEEVAKSSTGTKAQQALDAWLDAQIEKAAPEPEKEEAK